MLHCDLNARAKKHHRLHLTTKDRARRNSLHCAEDNALLHSFRSDWSDVQSDDAEKENIRLLASRRRVVLWCDGMRATLCEVHCYTGVKLRLSATKGLCSHRVKVFPSVFLDTLLLHARCNTVPLHGSPRV